MGKWLSRGGLSARGRRCRPDLNCIDLLRSLLLSKVVVHDATLLCSDEYSHEQRSPNVSVLLCAFPMRSC